MLLHFSAFLLFTQGPFIHIADLDLAFVQNINLVYQETVLCISYKKCFVRIKFKEAEKCYLHVCVCNTFICT